jgi:hypothetical protein
MAGKSALLLFFSLDIPVNSPLHHGSYRKRALGYIVCGRQMTNGKLSTVILHFSILLH